MPLRQPDHWSELTGPRVPPVTMGAVTAGDSSRRGHGPGPQGGQEGPGGHGRRLGPQDAQPEPHRGQPRLRARRCSTRPRARRPPRAGPAWAGRRSAGPGRPRRAHPGQPGRRTSRCRRPRAARRGGTGPPPRGPPGAASRRVACPRAPVQRTTLRSVRSGTMRSMPSSVSFWTTHSGRSPLTGAKATVRAGSARRLGLHGAVAADARAGRQRLEGRRHPPRGARPVVRARRRQ